RLWPALQAIEWIVVKPALLLAPAAEAAQCSVAAIERTGCQVLLGGQERDGCLTRQAGDRLVPVLRDKRAEVLGIALAFSAAKRERARKRSSAVWRFGRGGTTCSARGISYRTECVVYARAVGLEATTVLDGSSRIIVPAIAPNRPLAAIACAPIHASEGTPCPLI